MFLILQSDSKKPSGFKANRMDSTSDQVICIANFSRHLMNVIKDGLLLFHQALLVVTKNQTSSCLEFHFVEYMNDSKAHIERIKKKDIQELKDFQGFSNLPKFTEQPFDWEKMSIKKQFDFNNLYITVEDMRQKMQQIADNRGKYDLFSNNCQIVADQLTEQLLLEEIQNKNVTFLAQVEKQKQCGPMEYGESIPHQALFLATQKRQSQGFYQNFQYYIVEYLINRVNVYQFYLQNEPYNLEFLKKFNNEQSFWETQWTISRSEIYLKQTVQDIIDIMKKHVSYFFNDSQTIVNKTFKQIKEMQDQEKIRQQEKERRKQEKERKKEEEEQKQQEEERKKQEEERKKQEEERKKQEEERKKQEEVQQRLEAELEKLEVVLQKRKRKKEQKKQEETRKIFNILIFIFPLIFIYFRIFF